jgi:hypothetical protein
MARLLTELELDALNRGLARWYRGRLVPIMRGGDETEEEKAAREKAEADAPQRRRTRFTQEDVDRIVQERLARDRKDAPERRRDSKRSARRPPSSTRSRRRTRPSSRRSASAPTRLS